MPKFAITLSVSDCFAVYSRIIYFLVPLKSICAKCSQVRLPGQKFANPGVVLYYLSLLSQEREMRGL